MAWKQTYATMGFRAEKLEEYKKLPLPRNLRRKGGWRGVFEDREQNIDHLTKSQENMNKRT